MNRFAKVLDHEVSADFIDLNCGCPIDVICNRGAGSKLMTRPRKLCEMVQAMGRQLHSKNVTVKIRTGWDDKSPSAHKLLPELQRIRFQGDRGINAVFMHGRSRLQR
jgi:tRNA-dihydrouridine synthase 3